MNAKMRAKMVIESVQRWEKGETLRMRAVSGCVRYPEDGSDEDNTYAKFTPSATLELSITNPALIGKFNPGEKYLLDFTPAES